MKNFLTGNVCAIGNFDGTHLGHKALIERAVFWARKNKIKSIIFTFEPHPKEFLLGKNEILFLFSKNKKRYFFDSLSVSLLFLKCFNKIFSSLSAGSFVENFFINKLNIKIIIVGYNFRFGKNISGNIFFLNKLLNRKKIKLETINNIIVFNKICSSSVIRKRIKKGNIKKANIHLGRLFLIEGIVVCGGGFGRKIGFPSVNIIPKINLVYPKAGVYVTKVKVFNRFYCFAATNVGYRPTFNKSKIIILESFLLSFDKNIYGKRIKIGFLKKIREEKFFFSINSLIKQIELDIKYVQKNSFG